MHVCVGGGGVHVCMWVCVGVNKSLMLHCVQTRDKFPCMTCFSMDNKNLTLL